MEVRIRKGYMARRGFNKAEDYFETLTKLSGQWVKVDTSFVFDDQYNLLDYGIRVFDEQIDAVRGDVRREITRCYYCGNNTYVKEGEVDFCHKCGREVKRLHSVFIDNGGLPPFRLFSSGATDGRVVEVSKAGVRWTLNRVDGSDFLYYIHGGDSRYAFAPIIAIVGEALYSVDLGYCIIKRSLKRGDDNPVGLPAYLVDRLYKRIKDSVPANVHGDVNM